MGVLPSEQGAATYSVNVLIRICRRRVLFYVFNERRRSTWVGAESTRAATLSTNGKWDTVRIVGQLDETRVKECGT